MMKAEEMTAGYMVPAVCQAWEEVPGPRYLTEPSQCWKSGFLCFPLHIGSTD